MNRIDRPALRASTHQRRAAALAEFVRRCERKAIKGAGPGDRKYERSLEASVKPVDPVALDRLPRNEDE